MQAMALAALVYVPSASLAVKFMGVPLGVAYLAAVAAAVALIFGLEKRDPYAEWFRRHEWVVAAVWVVAMAVALAVLYPLANSGIYGRGSDRDDALIVGINALLAGRYPFYEHVYTGGLLSPMPSALLIGLPFHLLGNVVIQNFAFAVAGAFGLAHYLCAWRLRWALIALLSCGNVGFLQDYVTGGDFATAAIYLGLAAYPAARMLERDDLRFGALAVAAMVLGVAMCARPIYPVAGIVLSAYALRRHGARQAATFAAFAFGAAAAINLPFYLYDPAHFTPLHILSFVPKRFHFLDLVLPPLSVMVALLPAVRGMGFSGVLGVLAASLATILLPGAIAMFTHYPVSLSYLVPPALLGSVALLGRGGARAPAGVVSCRDGAA